MTKLYVSADIEGITGVVSPFQCAPSPLHLSAYEAAVDQMALEVRMVVHTALETGVEHVLINDSHMSMTNLSLDHVPDQVSLLSGKPKAVAMSAGLDSSFDGAVYVGYHAKAGTEKGVLCHSFHSLLYDVSINGVSYGEGGINALYASLAHQVPVVLASGDKAFCQEITGLIPELKTVCTKSSLGFSASLNRPESAVLADYQEKTEQMLAQLKQGQLKKNLLSLEAPYVLTLTFINSLCADTAMMIPGWTRLNGTQIQYETSDFHTLYLALQSAYSILAYSAPLNEGI